MLACTPVSMSRIFLAHLTQLCNGLEPFEQLSKKTILGLFLARLVNTQLVV